MRKHNDAIPNWLAFWKWALMPLYGVRLWKWMKMRNATGLAFVTASNHHFSWENPRFRLGHFPVRKLLVVTRLGISTIKSHGKPPFSHGFPMVFPWFSHGSCRITQEERCYTWAASAMSQAEEILGPLGERAGRAWPGRRGGGKFSYLVDHQVTNPQFI